MVSLVLIKHFNLHLPETLTPVAWATLIGGFVIFLVEFFAKNLYPHDDISWTEAILMGLAQVIAAAFPGASRSGSTIMTGMALGMKRPAATEFSFLLGIPTMFAASALDLFRYRQDLTKGGGQLFIDIALGFLVSMVVAFFVVKWLLRFVQSHTFNGFAHLSRDPRRRPARGAGDPCAAQHGRVGREETGLQGRASGSDPDPGPRGGADDQQ